jgi:hypothetical protein
MIASFHRWGWYVYGAAFLSLRSWGCFFIRHRRGSGNPRGLVCGKLGPVYAELGWVK